MADLYKQVNGLDDTTQIYEYGNLDKQNQMLFNSDRITINTKQDDIYLSSIKDIHIGTGRHLTISTNKDLYINSNKTFLGKEAKEGMVLGDTLIEVLNEIINLIPKIVITTQLGPQSPMPQIQTDISKVSEKIKQITSIKHKIEGN